MATAKKVSYFLDSELYLMWVHVMSLKIMYRPLKDLNGIPGAKDIVMCLTGYQRQDREDIMVCTYLFPCVQVISSFVSLMISQAWTDVRVCFVENVTDILLLISL